MKQRGIRYFAVFWALIILMAPLGFTRAADLNQLLQQKEQLNQDIQKNQAAAENKAQEAQSLSKQVSTLENDIKSTEQKISDTGNQIDNTQKEIDRLSGQIDETNSQLKILKQKVNRAIVEIYRSSSRSDFDLLFSGDTLGENSNEASYVSAVEIQVKGLHDKVEGLKAELDKNKADQEAKKKELDAQKSQQEDYKKSAEYQKNQKDKLLGMTQDQQASYETQVEKLKTEMTQISNQIYSERQKRLTGGREQLGGGSSGYPYSSIDEPDAWGFLTRECTSYAAWYLNVVAGKKFINTRPGEGSAYNWPNLARDNGLSVSGTPRVGAAISWSAGPLTSAWGHVAIVEKVNGDGTIDVSEYNWIRYSYSYRKNVNPGDYGSYSYIY